MQNTLKPDAVVLREIRDALGMTVEEFAAAVGKSPEIISAWEAAALRPRATFWRAVVELIADRGRIILENEAEAAERRLDRRVSERAADLGALTRKAEELYPQPKRKRRRDVN